MIMPYRNMNGYIKNQVDSEIIQYNIIKLTVIIMSKIRKI